MSKFDRAELTFTGMWLSQTFVPC